MNYERSTIDINNDILMFVDIIDAICQKRHDVSLVINHVIEIF